MAQYTITCACGCVKTYNICGKVADRQRKTDWLASQACPACRIKKEREAARQAAEKATANVNFPAFTAGSEKQVSWAETIRAEKIAKVLQNEEKYVAEIVNAFEDCSEKCARKALAETIEYYVANATDARAWIDRRHGNYIADQILTAAIDRAADMDDEDNNDSDLGVVEKTNETVDASDETSLRSIRGVGRVRAARIAEFVRVLGRALESVDELLAVRGIGAKRLAALRVALC